MTNDDFGIAFHEAFCTSGTSPTLAPVSRPASLHLVGC